MLLLWKLTYFDRQDKEAKDRCLYLNTSTLDPALRHAVEFVAEKPESRYTREILRFRKLFTEEKVDDQILTPSTLSHFITGGPLDYFEDETGQAITDREVAQIITGSPTAMLVPRGAKQHDIDFMLRVHFETGLGSLGGID
jgi:hypothetical protein